MGSYMIFFCIQVYVIIFDPGAHMVTENWQVHSLDFTIGWK